MRSRHASDFNDIKELLASKNLLAQNERMVNELNMGGFDGLDCCNNFLQTIQYLDKNNLLDQESLSRCLEISQTKEVPRYSWREARLYNPEVFNLISFLAFHKVTIGKEELNILLYLQGQNVERVKEIIRELDAVNLLNQDSFRIALHRILATLPTVTVSRVTKTSRRTTGTSRSELSIEGGPSVFPEPDKKRRISGGQGTIKPVYSKPEDTDPVHIIKKFSKPGDVKSPEEDKREAEREVKYSNLLRENNLARLPSYYFRRNKDGQFRVIGEWRRGKRLGDFTVDEIQQVPFEKRIQLIISTLSELNIFHSHYRVPEKWLQKGS